MATVIPKGKVWAIATIVTTKEDKLTKIQTRKWFVIVKELTPKRQESSDEHSSSSSKDRKPSRRPTNPPGELRNSQSTTTQGV